MGKAPHLTSGDSGQFLEPSSGTISIYTVSTT